MGRVHGVLCHLGNGKMRHLVQTQVIFIVVAASAQALKFMK